MADLGNLFFSLHLKDYTDEDIKEVRKKLEKLKVKLNIDISESHIDTVIKAILKQREYKVNITPEIKKSGKVDIAARIPTLRESINEALKRSKFKAKVEMVVEKAQVSDAIRQAFAKAGVQYNTTASDVRQQRILDIQARMAERAALAQQRLANAQRAGAKSAITEKEALGKLNNKLSSHSGLLARMKDELLNVYSVYTLKSFATSLVEIGGEFQKQHIALKAMLGDAAMASAMYGKIKQLAVESPFNFKELMGYTKQIAAFSIPYEEMYDTTKRLADISAGLGVDMGRIILAYGQVRSAAFLRGQEVRQFTEAGIPLLDELAQKFTELEGRVVSVGEVFDKISRREVPFQMVKDVLWELTDEGGKFYNMQEVLTESLSGKLAKLKDSYEIMLSEVAQANNGLLGDGLDAITALTGNWKGLVTALTALISAYGAYRAVMVIASGLKARQISQEIALKGAVDANAIAEYQRSLAMANTNRVMTQANLGAIRMLTSVQKLKVAFAGLGTAGWVGIVLSALVALGTWLYNSWVEANRLKNELDEIAHNAVISAQDNAQAYGMLVEQLDDATAGTREYNEILNKIQSKYGEYIGNIEKEANAYEYLKGKVEDVTKALRDKAVESAREEGLTKIEEGYADDISDAVKGLSENLKHFGFGKGTAKALAAYIHSELRTAIKNGTDFRTSDLINDVFEKSGAQLINGKYGNTPYVSANVFNSVQKLRNYISRMNNETAEFANTLNVVFNGMVPPDVVSRLEMIENTFNKEFKDPDAQRRYDMSKYEYELKYLKDIGQTGSEAYKSIERKIADINKESQGWIKTANDIFGSRGYNISNLVPSDSDKSNPITYFETLAERLETVEKEAEQLNKLPAPQWTEEMLSQKDNADKTTKAIKELFGALGLVAADFQKGGRNETDFLAELWNKRVQLIDKALSSYKEWSALEGKDAAAGRVRENEEFGSLFNGAYGFKLDLDNPSEAWEEIRNKLGDAEKQKELSLSLKVKVDKESQEDAKRKLKDTLDEIQKYVDDSTKKWDLFKSLREKTGNREFAMQLAFGRLELGETDMLKDFRERIEKELEGRKISFEEVVEMDGASMKKAGISAVEPLVKAYNDGMAELRTDTANNLADLVGKYRDYADRIDEIERKLQEDLASIRSGQGTGIDTERIVKERERQAREEIASVRFEEFKGTDDWAKSFEDMERLSTPTLERLIGRLEDFKDTAGNNLPVNDFKELVNAIRKLREETEGRSPFKTLAAGMREYAEASKRLKEAREVLESVRNGTSGVPITGISETSHTETTKLDSGLAVETKVVDRLIPRLKTLEEAEKDVTDAQDDLSGASDKISIGFNDIMGMAQELTGVLGDLSDMFDSLGNDSMADALGMMQDIGGGMINMAKGGMGFMSGLTSGNPLRMAQGAAGVIGGITGIIGSIAQAHDKKLDKAIARSEQRVESLRSAYDQLERSIDRSLGGNSDISRQMELYGQLNEQVKRAGSSLSSTFASVFRGLEDGGTGYMNEVERVVMQLEGLSKRGGLRYILGGGGFKLGVDKEALDALKDAGVGKELKNSALKQYQTQYIALVEQRRELEGQLRNEEGKKKSDSGRIADYQNQIAELNEQIRYFVEDLTKELYGIDFDGWAGQISDALTEAFANGEDAATAFETAMNNIMKSVANNIVKQLIVKPALDELQDQLFGEKGLFKTFSDVENNWDDFAEVLGDWTEENASKLPEMVEKALEIMDKASGGSVTAAGSGGTGGVTKDIQGVTENTANVLGSYLNGMRQDVSVKRVMQEKFFNEAFPKMSAIAQSQLRQLNAIARSTERNAQFAQEIRDIIDRCYDRGERAFRVR